MFFHNNVKLKVSQSADLTFGVFHNLPAVPGKSLEDSVKAWLKNTRYISADSLIRFIKSRDVNHKIYVDTDVPVVQCDSCKNYFISPVYKCKCGSVHFTAMEKGSIHLAFSSLNFYK